MSNAPYLRLRHAQRREVRRPDAGGRADPRRALGFVRRRSTWAATPSTRRRRPASRARGRTSSRYQSHKKAVAAIEGGKFENEIVQVEIPGKKGPTVVATDESPRKDTTLEALAKLRPAFPKDAPKDMKPEELTVTAGQRAGPERRRRRARRDVARSTRRRTASRSSRASPATRRAAASRRTCSSRRSSPCRT